MSNHLGDYASSNRVFNAERDKQLEKITLFGNPTDRDTLELFCRMMTLKR